MACRSVFPRDPVRLRALRSTMFSSRLTLRSIGRKFLPDAGRIHLKIAERNKTLKLRNSEQTPVNPMHGYSVMT